MTGVTIKILHGADRGKIFEDLEPPLTVGREEGNVIQLNDERVSRCHFKIQRDNDRMVLTDLESTNGTKVNGVESQLKILRHGDIISVGRSLLLVGSEAQIAARIAAIGEDKMTVNREVSSSDSSIALHLNGPKSPQPASLIQRAELPEIPDDLTPGQKAEFCEILDFLQHRLYRLISSAEIDDVKQKVTLKYSAWQRLLDAQAKLARMTRRVADPDC